MIISSYMVAVFRSMNGPIVVDLVPVLQSVLFFQFKFDLFRYQITESKIEPFKKTLAV